MNVYIPPPQTSDYENGAKYAEFRDCLPASMEYLGRTSLVSQFVLRAISADTRGKTLPTAKNRPELTTRT